MSNNKKEARNPLDLFRSKGKDKTADNADGAGFRIFRRGKRASTNGMLNSKEVLRKSLRYAVPACIFIGMYLPLLLTSIFSGEPNYYSPLTLIKVFFTSPNAWRFGVLLSAVISAFVIYNVVHSWRINLYRDKLGRKREFSLDYQPYGDAHWAEPCEYSNTAQIHPLEKCNGMILGQLTDDGSQCVDMFNPKRINKHVAVIGSSGSGKSFALVMPYIIQAVKQRHSVVITDPKGELYQQMAGYLEDHGYKVRRLDLITLEKSDGWDCLKFLRVLEGDQLEINAQVFATAVVSNIEGDDSVYSRSAIMLLKALVLYTILRKDIPEEKKTIARVNEMLQQQGVTYFESIFGKNCPPYMKPAQIAYQTFAQASPNLHGNIVAHLATGMAILQTSMLERILSTDDIDLNAPGDELCAYFCRFSATDRTFRFVSAVFFSMLFISLIAHADKRDSKKLLVPVDFVMDEFPSLGVLPSWLEKISNIRSYGITAIMIMQGMSQLAGNYGDDATMILGNCGTILNIGMNDTETAKWFQERMGVASIKVYTESDDSSANSRGSMMSMLSRESRGVGKDYLMSVSDLYNMDVDDTLIIFQHCHPIYAHKVPITAFPQYKECRIIRDEDIPHFDDAETRKRLREEERIRIEAYNHDHPYVEPVIDEEYEEPVDFSTMGTTEILTLIVKEDIKALKKKYEEKKAEKEAKPAPAAAGASDSSASAAAAPRFTNIYMDEDEDEDDIGMDYKSPPIPVSDPPERRPANEPSPEAQESPCEQVERHSQSEPAKAEPTQEFSPQKQDKPEHESYVPQPERESYVPQPEPAEEEPVQPVARQPAAKVDDLELAKVKAYQKGQQRNVRKTMGGNRNTTAPRSLPPGKQKT